MNVGEDLTTEPEMIIDKGFTLFELLIALAIGGILLTIGIPNFNQFLNGQSTSAQINELVLTIREARSTALNQNQTALIIPNGGNYSNGWQMGLDTNNDGVIENVRRVSTDANQLIFANNPGTLGFTSRGRTTPASPTLFSITPVNCNDIQNPRRDIDIALSGHIDITNCNCAVGPPCP